MKSSEIRAGNIFDQVPGLAVHDVAQFSQCFGGDGLIVPNPLQSLSIDAFIGQAVIGDFVLFHIIPHWLEGYRHFITPFCLL